MGVPSKPSYDVVIGGGGPAGSSLAIRLAKAGMTVLLAEQKRFPREKLCGEFMSPECVSHFEELGVSPAMLSKSSRITETVFFSRSGRSVAVPSNWFGSSNAAAIGLSRAEMDAVLLRHAAGLGVEVCEDTAAVGLLTEDDRICGVKLRGPEVDRVEVRADLVVDATGRSNAIVRKINVPGSVPTRARHVAFKTHLTGANVPAGTCEIYSYGGGYGGCNLVEGDRFNLCFIVAADLAKSLGSDAERVMREVVFTNPRANFAMKDAVAIEPWLAVPIQRFGRGTLAPREGLVTVGDSAAFIDPFTGSGILLALQNSKILSDAIERYWKNDLETVAVEYKLAYDAAFGSRLRWASRLRFAAFSPIAAELMVVGLGLSTPFRRRIARLTRQST